MRFNIKKSIPITTTTSTSTTTTSSTTTSTTTVCCNPIIDCTTTTINPGPPCINAIDFIFNIIKIYSETNNISFKDAITEILDNGFITNNCNICCPNCRYVIGFNDIFTEYANVFINPTPPASPLLGANSATINGYQCCINYSNYIIYLNNIEGYIQCCNNFQDCYMNIIKYFSDHSCENGTNFINTLSDLISYILSSGIVESGSFNGNSQLCNILDNFIKYSGEECFVESFIEFFTKGLIIECDDDGKLFIGGVDLYINLNSI